MKIAKVSLCPSSQVSHMHVMKSCGAASILFNYFNLKSTGRQALKKLVISVLVSKLNMGLIHKGTLICFRL